MKDDGKTKKQLMDELTALRRQIAKMEKSMEETKRTEETLKQKEALFNRFVELSPVAMVLMEGVPPQFKYTNQTASGIKVART